MSYSKMYKYFIFIFVSLFAFGIGTGIVGADIATAQTVSVVLIGIAGITAYVLWG